MTIPLVAITPDDINTFIKGAFPGIGSDCIEVGPRHAVARRVITAEHIRPGGYVSGPTQFAIADAALWYALFGAVGIEAMALTSELSIRFLRPAVGTALMARAELDHVGRRSVVGTVTMWMDNTPDRRVSVAQGTYVRPATV